MEDTINKTEEAEREYSLLVNTLNNGFEAPFHHILQNDEVGSGYRGLLLGRSFNKGASFEDLFTARLQHDVTNSEVSLTLSKEAAASRVTKSRLPPLSNNGIIEELWKTIAILLEGEKYKLADRTKFGTTTQQVNCKVVSALFNVGKKKGIQMKDIGIDYGTRIKMVDQCLEWSENQGRKLVTQEIAADAYAKFVGDITGKNRPDIDLILATEGFGQRLKSLMLKGPIDVQIGYTEIQELPATDRAPTVRTFEIVHASNGVNFRVAVIDNVLSSVYKEKWIKRLEMLPFMKGKKGKSGAYVRNASTTNVPAPVVIGRNLVYAGSPIDVMEKELIDIAVFFANYQMKLIEHLHPLYKVTYYCNQIHTMVGALAAALYGAHSDANNTCCSDQADEYTHVESDRYLPKPEEMQVATLVISNCKLDHSTELVYSMTSHDGTKKNNNVLGKVPLGSCCMHWQGPGSQATGILHEVKLADNISTRTLFRAVSTFRYVVDPQVNEVVFSERLSSSLLNKDMADPKYWANSYEEFAVISRCSSGYIDKDKDTIFVGDGGTPSRVGVMPIAINPPCSSNATTTHHFHQQNARCKAPQLDGIEAPAQAIRDFINLTSISRSDLFPKVTELMYKELAPNRRGHKAVVDNLMAFELSRGPPSRFLYEKGYLLEVVHSPGKEAIPCLHQINVGKGGDIVMDLPVPGEYYELSYICAEAGLRHTQRSHVIYSAKPGTQRVMIISRPYKNDLEGIQKILQRLDEMRLNPQLELVNDDFNGEICVYGSGGSPTLLGSFAPTASSNTKDAPMISIPPNQSPQNRTNEALKQMVDGEEVVTIYVNEALFNSSTSLLKKRKIDQMIDQFEDQLDDQLEDRLEEQLEDHWEDQFGYQLEGQFEDQFEDQLEEQLEEQLEDMNEGHLEDHSSNKDKLEHRTNPNMCRCLGAFYSTGYSKKANTDEEVLSMHGDDHPKVQQYVRFKLGPYYTFHFKTLLSNSSISEQLVHSSVKDGPIRGHNMKTLSISVDHPDCIEGEIPMGGVRLALSLDVKYMMTRTTMIRDFVNSGKVERYLREDCFPKMKIHVLSADVGDAHKEQNDKSNKMQGHPCNQFEYTLSSDEEVEAVTEDQIIQELKRRAPAHRKKMERIGVCIQELLAGVWLCSVAGALRYQKQCLYTIVKNGPKNFGGPLHKDSCLPTVFCIHPMPMPNRTLDVVSIGLRQDTYNNGVFERCGNVPRDGRIKYSGQSFLKDLMGIVFKSILLRFTGRLNAFYHYSQWVTRTNKETRFLPNIEDIDDFLEFVLLTTNPKDTQQKLSQWISMQHHQSIPASTSRYPRFARFIRNVHRLLPAKMMELLNIGSRQKVVACMKQFLVQCVDEHNQTGNLHFLAQQVLADVEEIFYNPFGPIEPEGIFCGNGSEQGLAMLKNMECQDSSGDQTHYLGLIVDYMHNKASNAELEMAGYQGVSRVVINVDGKRYQHQRSQGGKLYKSLPMNRSVTNKVNGRPFNATDAEHFLCKAWLIMKSTMANYNNAKQPVCTKPHCHPARRTTSTIQKVCPQLDMIMNRIVELYAEEKVQRRDIRAPSFCLMTDDVLHQENIGDTKRQKRKRKRFNFQ